MRTVSVDARPEIAAVIAAAVEAVLAEEARTGATAAPRAESAWRRAGILEAVSVPAPTTWRTTN